MNRAWWIKVSEQTGETDAYRNYNDSNSRTTIEMNAPDVRPAISGAVENMERYFHITIHNVLVSIGISLKKAVSLV